ncbi:hypothetical protein D1818_19470 [Aquimarina sp. BL5]|uniref:DUF6090 family protein n=1 Tax=Aquimarina sp. BL5 TaxID=1714860 RepID=UPI000E557563|nr:DUF6090 family protein [Aquimarina sp. BL5]AXT52894.1 hypothetical protein D1818_19470 [Aquimarina sp. BL5]RKN02289.1 hypothetical protein D7036_16745 [Aquimarina sp. BL5]
MKQLSQFIRETITVIIGILIALFINNWNEDRKDKEYLNQIFSSIEKELEESLIDLKKVIPKQLASADSIEVYMNNEEVSIYDIIIRANGVHAPRIKTNSWNAIANSKIELIEYEKLSALADIQERKENLSWRIEKQMDFMFQNIEKTDKEKKKVLKMTILDIVGAEKSLLSQIEKILKDDTIIDND